jgi:cytochrome b-561
MVAGLGFSFTWGLTSFRNPLFSKPVNKTIHVLCYTLAIVCFSVGLKAVWKSHDQHSNKLIANLYSLHSWIGLTAVVLFGQNFVLGLLHFANPSTPVESRKSYMPTHIFLGVIAFITAVIAVETGFEF